MNSKLKRSKHNKMMTLLHFSNLTTCSNLPTILSKQTNQRNTVITVDDQFNPLHLKK